MTCFRRTWTRLRKSSQAGIWFVKALVTTILSVRVRGQTGDLRTSSTLWMLHLSVCSIQKTYIILTLLLWPLLLDSWPPWCLVELESGLSVLLMNDGSSAQRTGLLFYSPGEVKQQGEDSKGSKHWDNLMVAWGDAAKKKVLSTIHGAWHLWFSSSSHRISLKFLTVPNISISLSYSFSLTFLHFSSVSIPHCPPFNSSHPTYCNVRFPCMLTSWWKTSSSCRQAEHLSP